LNFRLTKLTSHPRIERGGKGGLGCGALLLLLAGLGRAAGASHGGAGARDRRLVAHVGAGGRPAVGPGAARRLGTGGVGRVHRAVFPQHLVRFPGAENMV
jgi:hypothetical protein